MARDVFDAEMDCIELRDKRDEIANRLNDYQIMVDTIKKANLDIYVKKYDYSSDKFSRLINNKVSQLNEKYNSFHIETAEKTKVVNSYIDVIKNLDDFYFHFLPEIKSKYNKSDYQSLYNLKEKVFKYYKENEDLFLKDISIVRESKNNLFWTMVMIYSDVLSFVQNKEDSLFFFEICKELKVNKYRNDLEKYLFISFKYVCKYVLDDALIISDIDEKFDFLYNFVNNNLHIVDLFKNKNIEAFNLLRQEMIKSYNFLAEKYFVIELSYDKSEALFNKKHVLNEEEINLEYFKEKSNIKFAQCFYVNFLECADSSNLALQIRANKNNINMIVGLFLSLNPNIKSKSKIIRLILKNVEILIYLKAIEEYLMADQISLPILKLLLNKLSKVNKIPIIEYSTMFSIAYDFLKNDNNREYYLCKNVLYNLNSKVFNNFSVMRIAAKCSNTNPALFNAYCIFKKDFKSKKIIGNEISLTKEKYVRLKSKCNIIATNTIILFFAFVIFISGIILYNNNIFELNQIVNKIVFGCICSATTIVISLFINLNYNSDEKKAVTIMYTYNIFSLLILLSIIVNNFIGFIPLDFIENYIILFFIFSVFLFLSSLLHRHRNHKFSKILKIINSIFILIIILLKILK